MSKKETEGNTDTTEEESLDIPEPPDGGWGWIIVLASFLCNMIVDGICYSFGIFFMEFVKYYDAQKGRTAWIGSLLTGCYLSAGPVVGALTNRFGCRSVTMAGSVLSCIAFILSTFAPSVDVLTLTFGIMGGIGFGLIYLPAIVSVSYYFSTKRAFATGIAVCGSGMGAFVFAPVCQKLLDIYDWKGALMILSGFSLNCMVFGALMRPLESSQDRKSVKSQATEDTTDSSFTIIKHEDGTLETKQGLNTEPGVQSRQDIDQMVKSQTQFITLSTIGETVKPVYQGKNGTRKLSLMQLQTNLVIVHPDLNHRPLSPSTVREISRQNLQLPMESTSSISNLAINNRRNTVIDGIGRRVSRRVSLDTHRHVYRRECRRPIYRKDIFYSGSITSLAQYNQSQRDIKSYVASVTSLPETIEEEAEHSCISPSITITLKQMLNFSLLKHYAFLLLCISNVFGMIGFYIPFVYITDYSTRIGIPRSDAAFILSIIGITNTGGRMIFGWFADRPRVSSLWVNNVCLLFSGVSALCIPYMKTYTTIIVACTFFGLFISGYMCLTSVILVELVGLDRLTNAFGLLSLFRGAASIVGPPLAGSIYDVTGTYEYPFVVAGGMLIMSSLLSAFVPMVKRLISVEEPVVSSVPQIYEELEPPLEEHEQEV